MGDEYRIIGPPGTGKTTFLSTQVKRDIEQYGADQIVLASLTRAAAAEIAGRDLPIPPAAIGTLHAHCYRALGRPELVEKHLREWNEHRPSLALHSGEEDLDDRLGSQFGGGDDGDNLRERMDLARARLVPESRWPRSVQNFYHAWSDWKAANGYHDFTDLIESAYDQVPTAPGSPAVLMVDEAQDHSALEMRLVRRWAENTQRTYVVGDPDQAIFEWRGADPYSFQAPGVPAEHVRVLSQSYRVPRRVHRVARTWIKQIAKRVDAPYQPRDEDGEVLNSNATWQDPDLLLRQIERSPGKIMVLATCAYMLRPLIAVMRARGIPFHNPYRRRAGEWNPLASISGASGKTATAVRLLAYLRPQPEIWGSEARMWTAEDLRLWLPLIRQAGNLRRGAKERVKNLGTTGEVPVDALIELLEEPAFNAGMTGDMEWLWKQALAGSQKSLAYPMAVLKKGGRSAVIEQPKVCVGTIHSVKGGESDTVIVLPDLSGQGFEEWEHDTAATIRLFYVAMTRARQRLILAAPASRQAVSWQYAG